MVAEGLIVIHHADMTGTVTQGVGEEDHVPVLHIPRRQMITSPLGGAGTAPCLLIVAAVVDRSKIHPAASKHDLPHP